MYQGDDPEWPPEGDDGVMLYKVGDLIGKWPRVYQVENPFNIWWTDDTIMDAGLVLGGKWDKHSVVFWGVSIWHADMLFKTLMFLYRDSGMLFKLL